MNRRTFMRTATAATGAFTLAGCLTDDRGTKLESGDGVRQYDRPTHSGFTPAASHDSGSVTFLHVRLSTLPAVQQAVGEGRLSTGMPLVRLPLSSTGTVPEAVETLTKYPFSAALRTAVNDAVSTAWKATGETRTNDTLVDPITVPPDDEVEAEDNTTTETPTERTTGDSATASDRTSTEGITVTGVTLIDGLLQFDGSFDRTVIDERYTTGFEQVDEQRGMRIYEATTDRSGLAFAVGNGAILVPTESDDRFSPAETVLAHTLSRYVTSQDRLTDDRNGRWLFETTGSTALSFGVWGSTDRLDSTVGSPSGPTDSATLDFDVDGFISGVAVTANERQPSFEGRFSGLFSEPVPAEDELQTALLGEAAADELVVDEQRVHLRTSFVDE